MKITGTATLHAPPARVWTALNDPAVLARTIPGCEHLEVTGPGSCRLITTGAVASTRGTYTGEVEISNRQEPTSFRLTATAAGAPGTLSASVRVQLAATANGTTEITYDADAVPGGTIAAVGQRLLASTAKKLAAEFFASVDEALVTRAAPVPDPAVVEDVLSATPPRQPTVSLTGARPPTRAFLQGALAGTAATLAGVSVARLLRRRPR